MGTNQPQIRIAAFSEYIADVKAGRFPELRHLVEMEEEVSQKVIGTVGKEAR